MKILVGVDDSRFSADLVRAVVYQFRPKDTEVRVLHVLVREPTLKVWVHLQPPASTPVDLRLSV